jgi:hypothetical protein
MASELAGRRDAAVWDLPMAGAVTSRAWHRRLSPRQPSVAARAHAERVGGSKQCAAVNRGCLGGAFYLGPSFGPLFCSRRNSARTRFRSGARATTPRFGAGFATDAALGSISR